MWNVIQDNIFWLLIVGAVFLLVVLYAQLKLQIRRMIRNEIYDHFPSIKNKIEDYERRFERLRLDTEEFEKRLREKRA